MRFILVPDPEKNNTSCIVVNDNERIWTFNRKDGTNTLTIRNEIKPKDKEEEAGTGKDYIIKAGKNSLTVENT